MNKKNKLTFLGVFILMIYLLSMGIASALPTDLSPPEYLDPGDGSPGGPGSGLGPGVRYWDYTFDMGTDTSGDVHLEYVIIERETSTGWDVTYQIDLDYYYFESSNLAFQIQQQRGSNYWYRGWIGGSLTYNQEAFDFTTKTEDYGNNLVHEYIYMTETISYDSDMKGNLMGLQGGIIDLATAGNLILYYGCVLVFKLGETNYGNTLEYSSWATSYSGGVYGFFGQDYFCSYSSPQNAWYNEMDDMTLY